MRHAALPALALLAGLAAPAQALNPPPPAPATGTPGIVYIPPANVTFVAGTLSTASNRPCPVEAGGVFRINGAGPVAVTIGNTGTRAVTVRVSAVWRPAQGAAMQADSSQVRIEAGAQANLGTVVPAVDAPLLTSRITIRVTACNW